MPIYAELRAEWLDDGYPIETYVTKPEFEEAMAKSREETDSEIATARQEIGSEVDGLRAEVSEKMTIIKLPKGTRGIDDNHYYADMTLPFIDKVIAHPERFMFMHEKSPTETAMCYYWQFTGGQYVYLATNLGYTIALDIYVNGTRFDIWYHTKEYQDKLVSGTNIKTVNSQSIVGEGNLHVPCFDGEVSELVYDGSTGQLLLPVADAQRIWDETKVAGVESGSIRAYKVLKQNAGRNWHTLYAIVGGGYITIVMPTTSMYVPGSNLDNYLLSQGITTVTTRPTADVVLSNNDRAMLPSYKLPTSADPEPRNNNWDTAPTQGSVKPVTSGGIYDALMAKTSFDGVFEFSSYSPPYYYASAEAINSIVHSFDYAHETMRVYRVDQVVSPTIVEVTRVSSSSYHMLTFLAYSLSGKTWKATVNVPIPVDPNWGISDALQFSVASESIPTYGTSGTSASLYYDSTPTSGSNRLVTSGNIYSYVNGNSGTKIYKHKVHAKSGGSYFVFFIAGNGHKMTSWPSSFSDSSFSMVAGYYLGSSSGVYHPIVDSSSGTFYYMTSSGVQSVAVSGDCEDTVTAV